MQLAPCLTWFQDRAIQPALQLCQLRTRARPACAPTSSRSMQPSRRVRQAGREARSYEERLQEACSALWRKDPLRQTMWPESILCPMRKAPASVYTQCVRWCMTIHGADTHGGAESAELWLQLFPGDGKGSNVRRLSRQLGRSQNAASCASRGRGEHTFRAEVVLLVFRTRTGTWCALPAEHTETRFLVQAITCRVGNILGERVHGPVPSGCPPVEKPAERERLWRCSTWNGGHVASQRMMLEKCVVADRRLSPARKCLATTNRPGVHARRSVLLARPRSDHCRSSKRVNSRDRGVFVRDQGQGSVCQAQRASGAWISTNRAEQVTMPTTD